MCLLLYSLLYLPQIKKTNIHVFSSLKIYVNTCKQDLICNHHADDFRLFVGNLGREVNDRMLSMPFMQYPSFVKAHVVKNRETSMSRGCYGFVSFRNSVDYLRAIKELHGNIKD